MVTLTTVNRSDYSIEIDQKWSNYKEELTWRHLNFFQHHCYITASVPRVSCIRHRKAIVARWESQHKTARLEGLNSLFQAARARARGYRNPQTFMATLKNSDFGSKSRRVWEFYRRHIVDMSRIKFLYATQSVEQKTIFQGSLMTMIYLIASPVGNIIRST